MTSPTSCTVPASLKPGTAGNLEEDIRHLAYKVYELCKRQDGHDLDDWLFAEKQVKRAESGKVAV
jgi:hypothetical protein